MSEFIQSYEQIVSDGRTEDVARQLFALMNREDVVSLLKERGQRGVINRNSISVEQCAANIQKMSERGDTAFIIGAEENPERVVGVATSIGSVPLRSVKKSIASFTPAFIARRSNALSDDVKVSGNQLFAWTEPGRLSELAVAYKMLVEHAPTTGRVFTNAGELSLREQWTIEPVGKNGVNIHAMLYQVGFQAHSRGYFDDGELKLESVPQSILYKTL